MGYYHIDNLYRNQDILLFKECYAMEKIHGTSAHIRFRDNDLIFFSGGVKHENFIKLFDAPVYVCEQKQTLLQRFQESFPPDTEVVVFGEAYGGKYQGMSNTYGKDLKFVCFEVKIGDLWLDVPKAAYACFKLGLEFVYYVKMATDIDDLTAERDSPSVQAIRNGMGNDKMREGIVLRPLIEVRKNNGGRIIAKFKRDEFMETRTPRNITDKLVKLENIKAITDEWVTEERLNHILGRGIELDIENIGKIIPLMVEDIYREGAGEITESRELEKVIGRETALMIKRRLSNSLREV